MKKILIIGQAPPAVKQTFPYDTTLLYDIFQWVGINKQQAQDKFEFDAMTNVFPGHGTNGHLKPSMNDMRLYFDSTLKEKILNADKIIILGNVAKESLDKLGVWYIIPHTKAMFLIHPSKRNYSKIFSNRIAITEKLSQFINN